jgi:membrane-associated phospholipid phosphatase
MLENVYGIDHPYNSFPSIHVMSSYLLKRTLRNSTWKNKWHKWIVGCFSTSIILATLFIKQHVIMDVAAGIILVECLFIGVEFMYSKLFIQSRPLKTPAKTESSYVA